MISIPELAQGFESHRRAPLGSEAKRARQEIRLEDRLQHQLHCHLRIPAPLGHRFRKHLATDSGDTWAPVPAHLGTGSGPPGHRFRSTWAPIPAPLGHRFRRTWAPGADNGAPRAHLAERNRRGSLTSDRRPTGAEPRGTTTTAVTVPGCTGTACERSEKYFA